MKGVCGLGAPHVVPKTSDGSRVVNVHDLSVA